MNLKRKKIGDRSYNLIDTETGVEIATVSQTGEHGRDNYPWDWHMLDGRIFGHLGLSTGRSVESMKNAVEYVQANADAYGTLVPAGQIEAHTIREGQVFKHKNYLYRATQNAYFYGNDQVTITANNHKGELVEVNVPFEDQILIYLPESEARRALAIAKAKEEDKAKEEARKAASALRKMVRKLDSRNKHNSRGYVTKRDELIAILSEVSRMVPVVITEVEQPTYALGAKQVTVEIKLSLTLERDLL